MADRVTRVRWSMPPVDPWGNHLVPLDNSKGHLVTDGEGTVIGVQQ